MRFEAIQFLKIIKMDFILIDAFMMQLLDI